MFATTHMTPDAGAHDFFNESAHEVLNTGQASLVAFGVKGGTAYGLFSIFDGTDWAQIDTAINNDVVGAHIETTVLYAGGTFTAPFARILSSDGTTSSGFSTGITNNSVNCAIIYNGDLIVGGSFTSPQARIARWNGSSWAAMGSGMDNNIVQSLAVYGDDLYAAGTFTTIGGVTFNRIARWDGAAWNTMGSTGLSVTTLNSAGPGMIEWDGKLLICGAYNGGTSTRQICTWDGANFADVVAANTNRPAALAIDPASPSDFYAIGTTLAGGVTVNQVAKYSGGSFSDVGTGLTAGVTPRTGVFLNGELHIGCTTAPVSGSTYTVAKRSSGGTWSAVEGTSSNDGQPKRQVNFLSVLTQ